MSDATKSGSILVIGAGYIGLPLACALSRLGYDVTGWVASEASAKALRKEGLTAICADVADPSAWQDARLQQNWHAVYYCVSSSRGGVEAYERVYRQGLSFALELPARRFIYTSSTSVYGQTSGEWVDEKTPVMPLSPTSRILAEAEERVLTKGGTVARLAAIYGPGRGFLFQQWMRGEAVIEGDGARWLNQIHRDDIVRALTHLLTLKQAGDTPALFNVTDNEPVRLIDFYHGLSERFKRPMPPFGTAHETSSSKRAQTNKRVSNARLRATGWQPLYPTFREGFCTGAIHS